MFSAKRTRRLSHRIFRVFALTLLATATVFTASFLYAQKRMMEVELLERGRALGMLLASGAKTAVFAENAALVEDSLHGVLEHEEVLSAAVFTANGNLLAAAGRTAPERERAGALSAAAAAALGAARPGGGCVDLNSADRIELLCPVVIRAPAPVAETLYFAATPKSAAHVEGFVKLAVDRGPMRRSLEALVVRSALLAGVLLLAGTASVFLLARRVTEPLERLTEAVRIFGARGEIRPLPTGSPDEIGRLAETFATMTRDLEAREREKELLGERLRHAQKMEAVGMLSQGVSHDFKNILSTLKTAVHILQKGAADNDFVQRYAARMQTTLERARELVERLVTFSRTRELTLEAVDLAALVERLVPSLREALGEHVRLNAEIGARPVPVLGDAPSLEQLLVNLVYNARDAMPEGGIVCLRLGVEPRAGAGAADGPALARLEVRDTGTGMDSEVRRRIFEPFFTTKDPGVGMGLGLSIVRGIVEEHHGRIAVDSAPGEGTTFTVGLPLAVPAAAAGAAVGAA